MDWLLYVMVRQLRFKITDGLRIGKEMEMKFENVTVFSTANVYFGGKVVSHTLQMQDGTRKTFGVIFPGTFDFKTEDREMMEITDGTIRVFIEGRPGRFYGIGEKFEVPANSSFLVVCSGRVDYICTYYP